MKKKAYSINPLLPLFLLFVVVTLIGCSSADTGTEADADSIENIIWQWVSVTNQDTSDTTTVPNPEDYTLIFRPDGSVEGQADCNSIGGTYSQEGGFTVTIETSTMAFCGENSLDLQYLELLGNVVAGGPDGAGGFALENAGGQMRMKFQNGGPAPEA